MRYGIGLLAALLLAAAPAFGQGPLDLCDSVDFAGDLDPVCTDLDCGTEDLDGDGTGDDCTTTKYGLGHPDDRSYRQPPGDFDFFAYGPDDFSGSYIQVRSDPLDPAGPGCGPERSFTPYSGQVLIREQDACTPTAEFPTCSGGTRDGEECRLVGVTTDDSSASAAPGCLYATPGGEGQPAICQEWDCPGGGTCDTTGGCKIEIPFDLPGDENASSFASGLRVASSSLNLMSSTSPSFSGTSDPTNNLCLEKVRRNPAQGWRFVLPASRGGGNGETYIRFHGDKDKGLYRHDEDSKLCCLSLVEGICQLISRGEYPEYPDILERDCTSPGSRIFRVLQTGDWLFDADPALPPYGQFEIDLEHIIRGQQQGLCLNNRTVGCVVDWTGVASGDLPDLAIAPCTGDTCNPNGACIDAGLSIDNNTGEVLATACCTGPGTGACALGDGGGQCNGRPANCSSDPDCELGDTCDLREPGFRNARPFNDDGDGDGIVDLPSPNCNTSATFFRGTPRQYCSVVKQYAGLGSAGVPSGDPGSDCGIWNFGARPLPDFDCNGLDDRDEAGGVGDQCPFLNEFDPLADADGDCTDGDPSTPCRGDECECGDQTLDGMVNIADILEINDVIFELVVRERLGDTNNDLAINVSDILGANAELFVPNSAECRHVTRLGCGNGVVDLGEQCDDGNVENLDGCSTACRVE